ncbi:MAG: hypothetical protein JJE52_06565 [Acidimicrobiia bacterium]|nr:hypothetical protein [Acidimicrobiia bacterium]
MTARRLDTTYTHLTWSEHGTLVTKRRAPSPGARRQFRNEWRVNRLVLVQPPPGSTPAMVGHDAQHLSLTFEAVDGEPFGPKYPPQLEPGDLDAMAELAQALVAYSPRRRWMRRLDSVRRLRASEGAVLIDWEWAGLYPPGYDLAFLWFSVGEVSGALAAIEARNDVGEDAFLLAALIVELWHLQWFVPPDFRAPHLATRDELVGRLLT